MSQLHLLPNFCHNLPDTSDSNSGILLWDISDHFPIFYIQYKLEPHLEDNYRIGRSITEKNKNHFSETLLKLDWSSVTSDNDTQSAYTKFHDIITKSYNSSFPLKKTKIGYINKLPWLSIGLKNSIKRKHKLHTIQLKNPTIENKVRYKSFKNKLTNILRSEERNFYQNEMNACKGNMRKSWKVIKSIINKNSSKTTKLPKITINGKLCDDPQMIAE